MVHSVSLSPPTETNYSPSFLSKDGVGLSRARLTVRHDSSIVPSADRIDDPPNRVEYLTLSRLRTEHGVVRERSSRSLLGGGTAVVRAAVVTTPVATARSSSSLINDDDGPLAAAATAVAVAGPAVSLGAHAEIDRRSHPAIVDLQDARWAEPRLAIVEGSDAN